MKVTLAFVPPNGGESDYSLDFEMPGIPQPGDYISVKRPGETGYADFIVRRSWWHLSYPNDELSSFGDRPPVYGETSGVMVECEFALGPHSTESHKRACESYKHRKGSLKEFDDTAF